MRYTIASVIAAAASATALNSDYMQFVNFVAEFGKHYGTTEEFNFRMETFSANLQKIKAFKSET